MRFLLFVLLATLPMGASAETLDDWLNNAVDSHRRMIVLADGSVDGASPDQAVAAARHFYAQGRNSISHIIEQAERDSRLTPSNRLTATTSGFLDYVADTDTLRDGDLLAFLNMADDLLHIERRRLGEGPRLAPLQTLNDEIAAVLDSYREEYARAMDQLGRRGAEDRESWQSYIGALEELHSYEELLEWAADNGIESTANVGRRLSAQGAHTEGGSPQVLWGHELPEKTVVLTFDDGPHRQRTNRVLDILAEYGATAYFFVLGNNLGSIDDSGDPSLTATAATARRIVEEGHILGNHSYSHPQMPHLDTEEQTEELARTNQLISIVSESPTRLFRAPYGARDDSLQTVTIEQEMASIMWNVDSMDWADPVPESIADRTIRAIEEQGRGILLFHDVHRQTVEALPDILTALAERDYRVVALDGQPFDDSSDGSLTMPEREQDLYGKSWAAVIGVNDYQHWPDLEYAVNDAQAVGDMLAEDLGFVEENIFRLTDGDATRENIMALIGETLADPDRVAEEDRVFIFFAGHGTTRSLPAGGSLGYIIPSDADYRSYQNRAISMSTLNDLSSVIPAKHVFFVMDSCYSGLALTRAGVTVGNTRGYLEQITSRRTRQILTAGDADQQVADGGPGGHSIFTWSLLQGLSGLADTDDNGFITASELGTYMSPVVSSYADQTPKFGHLAGSAGGDFAFEVDAASIEQANQRLEAEARRMERSLASMPSESNEQLDRRLNLHAAEDSTGDSPDDMPPVEPEEGGEPDGERIERARQRNAEAMRHFRAGRYEAARTEWAEAVRLNPYNPTIVNNYGYVLDRLDENEEALRWYFRTVELAPRRTPIYLNLGDIMVELERFDEAIPYYERYLHLYPSYEKADELRERIEELSEREQAAST